MSINSKKKKGYLLAKEILTVTFSTPAAVGVIAEIDHRIDISPALEKIIVHYKLFIHKFWDVVLNYFQLNIKFDKEIASFLLFISISTAFNLSKKLLNQNSENAFDKFWSLMSVIFVIIFSFCFGVVDDLMDGSNLIDYLFPISVIVLLISIGVPYKKLSKTEAYTYSKNNTFKKIMIASMIVSAAIGFFYFTL